MKQGRRRTMSICLTDIKEKAGKYITKSEKNGKLYIELGSFDFDESNQYNKDFSVTIARTKEELEKIKAGEKIDLIFVGNGKIWPDTENTASPEEVDDLPF